MSADRWIVLLTEQEYEDACKADAMYFGEDWFHCYPHKNSTFCFGDATDCVAFGVDWRILEEIEAFKTKVDNVVALLTFLFLQGSESGQLDMFERFLAANLGKGKIVHFWSE